MEDKFEESQIIEQGKLITDIDLLQEQLNAQRIMLEDALMYAAHLEGKIQSIVALSFALQNQIIDLKNTADNVHLQATILT